MHAREVARVRELPGEADRGVEPGLELLVEGSVGLRPAADEAQPSRVEVVGQRAEAFGAQRRAVSEVTAARRRGSRSMRLSRRRTSRRWRRLRRAGPPRRAPRAPRRRPPRRPRDGHGIKHGSPLRAAGSAPERNTRYEMLPPDFGLTIDARFEGRTLLGGEPFAIVHLSERAAARIRAWVEGAPVGDRRARPRARAGEPGAAEASGAHRAPPVTVVIPVRDRSIARLLAALDVAEVIVVDDASVDGGALRAEAEAFGARYVRRERAGARGRRATRAWRWRRTSSSRVWTATASRSRAGWTRCCRTSPTRR